MIFPFISSVCDYVPLEVSICRRRGSMVGVGWARDASITWSWSPPDRWFNTCAKGTFKWSDRTLQIDRDFGNRGLSVDASGWSDLYRMEERSGKHGLSRGIVGRHVDTSGALDHHQTALIKGKRGLASWDHASSSARDRGCPSELLKIEQSTFFGQNLL